MTDKELTSDRLSGTRRLALTGLGSALVAEIWGMGSQFSGLGHTVPIDLWPNNPSGFYLVFAALLAIPMMCALLTLVLARRKTVVKNDVTSWVTGLSTGVLSIEAIRLLDNLFAGLRLG